MIGSLPFVAALLAFASPVEEAAPAASSSPLPAVFFANISKLCGQRFEGATEFPPDPNHPLAGKKLVISIEQCSDQEIRIPLQAGEDTSRTWIITLSDEGLLLKHDHRHPDGTPDEVTMYGGWATKEGTATRQSFVADPATAQPLPEAATNVWTIEIDSAKRQLTYALERNNAPRYKAVFELQRPRG